MSKGNSMGTGNGNSMGAGSQMNGGAHRLYDKITGERLNYDRWQVIGHS